ncbi:MAG: flagellar basal body L-ring protein FlgH [Phycisphaerales bacterium JB063]
MRKTSEQYGVSTLVLSVLLAAGGAGAQTSSLHDRDASQSDRVAADRYGYDEEATVRDDGPRLNPEVSRYTSVYARRPDPDRYGINDLVTIVVRESFDTQLESEASSEKSVDHVGGIRELPRLSLNDLLDLQIRPNTFPDGRVQVDVGYESEFEGEGEYARSETMTGRITARVVDIRPNGTLVLEARKTLVNDGEEVSIVATGICRVQDITPENTVLSTQLYDLFIDKQHEGELKDTTEKGFLSELLDFIFPF